MYVLDYSVYVGNVCYYGTNKQTCIIKMSQNISFKYRKLISTLILKKNLILKKISYIFNPDRDSIPTSVCLFMCLFVRDGFLKKLFVCLSFGPNHPPLNHG